MRGIHSFWSAPNRGRNSGEIVIPDYELLTMMLSALKWQQQNGSICMITDSAGAAFFEHAGLAGLWGEGLNTALDDMDPTLDPQRFWAAGKLAALRTIDAPCVMLDTDLIVWSDLSEYLTDAVVAAHREALEPDIYPDPADTFELAEDYAFPAEWDFTLPAANTAFLYLPDNALKTNYIHAAFAFMRALQNAEIDPTVSMCFAEQRILPMCAAAQNVPLRTLLNENTLNDQTIITHLWGHKNELAASPEQRVAYCLRCVLRLLNDFPEWENALAANKQTVSYLESLR